MFDAQSDLHIELAEELLACLFSKSKWNMGFWTWVSFSNLEIQYDGKVIHNYNSGYYPERVPIQQLLTHLINVGLIERNPDLFLKDQFYRLTQLGRELLSAGGDAIYDHLSKQR